jgi:hypothetical protein
LEERDNLGYTIKARRTLEDTTCQREYFEASEVKRL